MLSSQNSLNLFYISRYLAQSEEEQSLQIRYQTQMGLTCLVILVVSNSAKMLTISDHVTTNAVKSSIRQQGLQHNVCCPASVTCVVLGCRYWLLGSTLVC